MLHFRKLYVFKTHAFHCHCLLCLDAVCCGTSRIAAGRCESTTRSAAEHADCARENGGGDMRNRRYWFRDSSSPVPGRGKGTVTAANAALPNNWQVTICGARRVDEMQLTQLFNISCRRGLPSAGQCFLLAPAVRSLRQTDTQGAQPGSTICS